MRPTMFLASLLVAGCGGSVAGVLVDDGAGPDGGTAGRDAGSTIHDAGSTTHDAASLEAGQTEFDAGNCGGPGQRCCLGFGCNGLGCCVDDACVAQGTECGDSLGTCAGGGCGACGAVGEPCCAESQTAACSSLGAGCGGCTAVNATCPGSQLGATCVACGGDQQPCCNGIACAGAFMLCIDWEGPGGTCTSQCGQLGQPCCQDNYEDEASLACQGDGVCMLQSPDEASTPTDTVCVAPSTCGYADGQCTTCGLLGQACCEADLCVPGQGQCSPAENGQPSVCAQAPPPTGARKGG
jgi:hypothetical protein